MNNGSAKSVSVRVASSFRDIDATAWDHCSGGGNPFISHRFLLALEETGCTVPQTGWSPCPVLLEDSAGNLAAAAPAYEKTHSYGEYVFDHGWAEAYERVGGCYYPKIQVAVPFTPVPGARLLLTPGPNSDTHFSQLAAALVALTENKGASSVHITFCTSDSWSRLSKAGYELRTGEQFHWLNNNYRSFDDFLAALTSRKRKAIRKERQAATANGDITFRVIEGAQADSNDWNALFDFYVDTGNRKWGTPYLNREFFHYISDTMADDVMLIIADFCGTPIAGALHFKGRQVLYGRYWGAVRYQPALHFEVCYYQAIEYAIRNGIQRIEAGAQGPHKLSRGYMPTPTYSAHWIADPAFRAAVAEYLSRERLHTSQEIAELNRHSPFRRD